MKTNFDLYILILKVTSINDLVVASLAIPVYSQLY